MQYQEGRWAAYHHMFQKVKLLTRQSHLLMTTDLELSRMWCIVQIVIWALPPCHLLANCLLKVEEALSSTLLVGICQTADCHIPEGSILDAHHRETPDLISELLCVFCVRDWQLEEVFLYCEEQKEVTSFFGRSLAVIFCA